MATWRALTIQSGTLTQISNSDTVIAGAGVTTASGSLTLSAAGSNVVVNTALQFAAGVGVTVAAGSSAFDFSAGTGLFKTSTGAVTIGGGSSAVTITAGAASTWSTSSGALTITSNQAATWSTANGVLTLNGAAGITLQGGGTSALVINSSGTAITVQAGATLGTTSTGMINLPTQFQINSAAVSTNVTATNLNTLTAGSSSNADSLHTHVGVGASQVVISGLTTTGVTTGLWGYGSGASAVSKTDNAAIGTARAVGVNTGTSGSLVVAGLATCAFTTAGGSPGNGAAVYLAAASDDSTTGAGKLTATAPSSGVVAQVGLCVDNTNYSGAKTAVVVIQVKDPVVL